MTVQGRIALQWPWHEQSLSKLEREHSTISSTITHRFISSWPCGHCHLVSITCRLCCVYPLDSVLCEVAQCSTSILHRSLTSFIPFQPPTLVLSIIPNIKCLIIQALSILLASKENQFSCQYLLHVYSVQLTCFST